MNNNHDLAHEFFTKVKGWEKLRTGMWASQDKHYRNGLPPISTSWDAFHEWVVPEFQEKYKGIIGVGNYLIYIKKLEYKLGEFFREDKPPQRALEWAMKELQS